jgi:hypothetical protein
MKNILFITKSKMACLALQGTLAESCIIEWARSYNESNEIMNNDKNIDLLLIEHATKDEDIIIYLNKINKEKTNTLIMISTRAEYLTDNILKCLLKTNNFVGLIDTLIYEENKIKEAVHKALNKQYKLVRG